MKDICRDEGSIQEMILRCGPFTISNDGMVYDWREGLNYIGYEEYE